MKHFKFAFLSLLFLSMVFISFNTLKTNANRPSSTTDQAELIIVPESTNAVNFDGKIYSSEWDDAYYTKLTLWNYTDPEDQSGKDYSWSVEFWIKRDSNNIFMAEKINNPEVNHSFSLMVTIVVDMFGFYPFDLMGVRGDKTHTFEPLDMFGHREESENGPEPDDNVTLGGSNDVYGSTYYSYSSGPSAEWTRPLETGDNCDIGLHEGMAFFVMVLYDDGYQHGPPAMAEMENLLVFTLESLMIPYSTTNVYFDGNIDEAGEWGDAFYNEVYLTNGTEEWTGHFWLKYNDTHLMCAMVVYQTLTAGNFTFMALIANSSNFDTNGYGTDLLGVLGDNSNSKTKTYDLYFVKNYGDDHTEPEHDVELGGSNDTYGATYYHSVTGIRAEYCHPLNSGDPYDVTIRSGDTILAILAYGNGWWHPDIENEDVGSPGLSYTGALLLEDRDGSDGDDSSQLFDDIFGNSDIGLYAAIGVSVGMAAYLARALSRSMRRGKGVPWEDDWDDDLFNF